MRNRGVIRREGVARDEEVFVGRRRTAHDPVVWFILHHDDYHMSYPATSNRVSSAGGRTTDRVAKASHRNEVSYDAHDDEDGHQTNDDLSGFQFVSSDAGPSDIEVFLRLVRTERYGLNYAKGSSPVQPIIQSVQFRFCSSRRRTQIEGLFRRPANYGVTVRVPFMFGWITQ